MKPAAGGAWEMTNDSELPWAGVIGEEEGGALAPTQQAAQALQEEC